LYSSPNIIRGIKSEYEMGKACSVNRNKKCVQNISQKPEGK